MVAGSWHGHARGVGEEGTTPFPNERAWLTVAEAVRAGIWPAAAALYLLAAACLLLPWPFGAHPAWAYNWEGYTAWRWAAYWEPPAGPALAIWAPTDGLMTDSGQGPLVGAPVALGAAVAGIGVTAMRVPVALLAAACVPLLWLLGRRVAGPGPATLAALLLAISPVFLFYGRTATLVGVSLLPLLLAALALARVLDAAPADGWRWRREGLLAGSLLLGIFAYAPVRLLWPLAVGVLCLAALRDRARRAVLLRAALLCLLAVPAATMALEWLAAPEPDPLAAAARYFHARGEQIVAMRDDPAAAGYYLRDTGAAELSGWAAAVRLIGQNAADLGNLLLDRGTRPIPTDFWNESGRLWPWFLLPFALVAAVAATWRAVRGGQPSILTLVPLLLCLGLTLPLLLTSRVHVGRLVPALPFALLLVAAGAWLAAGWLGALLRHAGARDAARWAVPALSLALLLPAAALARNEMETPIPPTRESLTAAVLADWHADARERGGAVLVEDPALGDDIERVHAATYRLDLDHLYRFVDLQDKAAPQTSDPRPALLWRGALESLEAGEIADPCGRLWFVTPEIADEFLAAWHIRGCSGAPDSVILP